MSNLLLERLADPPLLLFLLLRGRRKSCLRRLRRLRLLELLLLGAEIKILISIHGYGLMTLPLAFALGKLCMRGQLRNERRVPSAIIIINSKIHVWH